ncbi:hypothetical protein [Streptomyces yangpuensis]|uniref:hypothetical protein n=1 Tax=Streptomyces yangpuensis TaxID=1648182 RepID=UPI0035D8FC03
MTDAPYPRSADGARAALVPVVVPVAGADAELVAVGERYWALAGFHPELGTAVWCEKTAQIDTCGWGRQVHAVAAAGVRALVEGVACATCGEPLSLTSRSAFQQLLDGQEQACVDCSEFLQAAVKLVLSPARREKRERQRAAESAQRVASEARSRWYQQQSEAVAAAYPAELPSGERELPVCGVREMLGALALLRYAPASDRIRSVGSWPVPLHPDPDDIADVLAALVRASLIAVHPSTPAHAMVWAPASFEVAVHEAGGDLDGLPPPRLTHGFCPTLAHYFAPVGLDGHLATALTPADMTADGQSEVVAVAHELLTAEGLRYFAQRLEQVRLPPVPDHHVARLRAAMGKAADHRPLGEIYNLVWRATRAAAEAAQKNPQATRVNLSTHALNQFEGHVQRAVDEPDWEIRPFQEVLGFGLAAMTRTLFSDVLDMPPLETGLAEVAERLPGAGRRTPAQGVHPAPAQAGAGEDPLAQLLVRLSTTGSWHPEEVLDALERIKQAQSDGDWFDGRIVAREAGRLLALHRRLAPAVGSRNAVLAVLGATDMLLHPISVGAEQTASGRWIAAELCAVLVPDISPFEPL